MGNAGCTAIKLVHPVPSFPLPKELSSCAAIAETYADPAAHNVPRDTESNRPWIRRLPGHRTLLFLGNVGVMLDGMATLLRSSPTNLVDDSQSYYCMKKAHFTCVDLIGVDCREKYIFTVQGIPSSERDQGIWKRTALYKACLGWKGLRKAKYRRGFKSFLTLSLRNGLG